MSEPPPAGPSGENPQDEDGVIAIWRRLPEPARHPLVIGVAGIMATGLIFLAGVRIGELAYEMGWTLAWILGGVLAVGTILIAVGVRLDRRARSRG